MFKEGRSVRLQTISSVQGRFFFKWQSTGYFQSVIFPDEKPSNKDNESNNQVYMSYIKWDVQLTFQLRAILLCDASMLLRLPIYIMESNGISFPNNYFRKE